MDELQKSYPQWYSQVYSEASPPVGCPAHMHMAVKRMQSTMACRSSRAGCGNLGNPRVGQSTMGNAVQMLLNMQMANQMANPMHVPMEQSLPGLVVYPPRRGQSMDQGLPGPLAQPDSEPAAPAVPAPALALPAPTAACSQGLPGSQGALGKHVAALQGILAQKKQPPSNFDDEDEDEDEEGQGQTPETKKKQPPTETPPSKHVKKTKKRPAAAKPQTSPSSSLPFPGSKTRPPLAYGNSKVYFGKDKYRLLERIGDKQDKAYSFKVKDPKEVWKTLAKRLKELNP